MEVDITSKKENPLLDRVEVHFTVFHPGQPSPKRQDVREKLAALLNTNQGLVVVDEMNTPFGRNETKGYAKAYESVDGLRSVENEHLLVRNGIPTGNEEEATAEE